MKKPDRFSSTFWLIFSIFVCFESYRLDIGDFHNPGPGFSPFLMGAVFGILSIILLILSFIQKDEVEAVFEKIRWKSVILVLAALFIYSIFLEKIGFVGTTFLFVVILLGVIEGKKWYIVIFAGIASALLSYIIFQLWLQSQLPKGIFGL